MSENIFISSSVLNYSLARYRILDDSSFSSSFYCFENSHQSSCIFFVSNLFFFFKDLFNFGGWQFLYDVCRFKIFILLKTHAPWISGINSGKFLANKLYVPFFWNLYQATVEFSFLSLFHLFISPWCTVANFFKSIFQLITSHFSFV